MLCGSEGILCVRVQGNKLYVGYAASNEPIKLISEFAAEFELPKDNARGVLTFSAGDGSAVLLDTVSVYSLDAEVEIATQNYDPNLIDDIDVVKPEFGEQIKNGDNKNDNRGLIIALVTVGAVLACAAIVAVTVVLVKRGKRK